ncbi:hypothetical protein HHX47_DHR3000403 [Lentinula edodes]|nr:hypothetical protein HHX47_DHR3000403 [Lentinula edodes]
MDFKAARPFAGFLDVTSHHFCYICDCWHNSHLGRTDYENWQPIDDEFLRKGAELWRDAAEVKLRKAIEDLFGTRSSELWRLPYWQASRQLGVDPMHIFFLILMQRYFRDILGLDNPDEPKKTPKKPRFRFAFYHEFTPPPSLSSLAANSSGSQEDVSHSWTTIIGYRPHPLDEHRFSLLEWPHLSSEHRAIRQTQLQSLKEEIANDSRASQSVADILNDLCDRAPVMEAEWRKWYLRIHKHKWHAILYICDNLAVFPNEGYSTLQTCLKIAQRNVRKSELTNILMKWRTSGIKELQAFIWPYFTPTHLPTPDVPWAPSHNFEPSQDGHIAFRKFEPGERLNLLTELTKSMSFHSATHIGNIHRLLQQPLVSGQEDLRKALKQSNGDALAYVCTDIE